VTALYEKIKFSDNGRGRPPAFESPEQMWERAVEYFKWVEASNLEETKLFSFQGEVVDGKAPLMRAMTQAGLCAFLNIGQSTYKDYKQKPNFSAVTEAIDDVMTEQKFTGAACGLFNANIIARDLGLQDRVETELSGGLKVEQTLAQRLTGGSKR
jgi:hypothetical protein